jgi:hypothetical protein
VQRLDLSAEMRAVRTSGVRTTVVSCGTDALVTADARQAAALTGGRLVELALPGRHLWMFSHWATFAAELRAAN